MNVSVFSLSKTQLVLHASSFSSTLITDDPPCFLHFLVLIRDSDGNKPVPGVFNHWNNSVKLNAVIFQKQMRYTLSILVSILCSEISPLVLWLAIFHLLFKLHKPMLVFYHVSHRRSLILFGLMSFVGEVSHLHSCVDILAHTSQWKKGNKTSFLLGSEPNQMIFLDQRNAGSDKI